jgi:hypothetical protein
VQLWRNFLACESVKCRGRKDATSEILGASIDEVLEVAAADEEPGAAIGDEVL